MDSADSAKPQDAAQREEWFLGRLGEPNIATSELLSFLSSVASEGNLAQADAWAELLQDALVEKRASDDALQVVRRRAEWDESRRGQTPSDGVRPPWKTLAERALEGSGEKRDLVKHAGFENGLRPLESFRRLDLLLSLHPGVMCLDKTWGFGIVKSVDAYYGRAEIDFKKKPRHGMSLAYMAEALQLLRDDHLLARLHKDPEGMKAMAKDRAGEVVRVALQSYGPLTSTQLQETLVPAFVEEADWKRFWDAARRDLKKDPLVHIPAKRTEPIKILAKERSYDAEWFRIFGVERDMKTVLKQAGELIRNGFKAGSSPQGFAAPTGEGPKVGAGQPSGDRLDETALKIVGERLAFVVKGAGRSQPDLMARAAMAALDLAIPADQVDTGRLADMFFEDELFLETARSLPARDIPTFVRFLAARDSARAVELLLRQLTHLNLTTLDEAILYLKEQGAEPRAAEIVRAAFAAQATEVEFVYWVTRHPAEREAWGLGSLPVLAHLVLLELEKDYMGERLKVQNLLRDRFASAEWLDPVLAEMDERQRRETVLDVRESPAWTPLDRQSLLAHMIKLYPELHAIVLSAGEGAGAQASSRGPVTSNRSYWERQAQYAKLVNQDIPENSKEIAVARSYGDLSENHEYKAAKEMQGILLRRRAELESMLQRVKPTDFSGLSHDRVGMGTGVVLEYPDGHEERYSILGEWDQDSVLGIISCGTRMARALEGRRAGETVAVPTEHGEVTCKLKDVTDLPEAVRAWIEKA